MKLIFDGNFMAHRARHTTGRLRNGIAFGMLKSMHTVCRRFNTNDMTWVFDGGKSQKRIDALPDYKADRGVVDGLFSSQVDWVVEALDSLGASLLVWPGVEADDIIGALAKRHEGDVIVVSSDKDFLQLIDENISVFNPIKNELTSKEDIENWLGGEPVSRYLEVKSMIGDPSDSIPGIKGIGIKTAIKSLKDFESFDSLPSSAFKGRMCVINEPETIEILRRNHGLMRLPEDFHHIDIRQEDMINFLKYVGIEMERSNVDLDRFESWIKASGMRSILNKLEEWNDFYGREN